MDTPMKCRRWTALLAGLLLAGCSADADGEEDECADTEETDTDECSVVSGVMSEGTGETNSSTGGTDTTGNSTDTEATTSESSESGDSAGDGSSWWMEVSGPLSIPRSEGDVVANTLTPGSGGVGGSSVNGDANFQAVVNRAGEGPGTYEVSTIYLHTADGGFSCFGSVVVDFTVNVLDPLDADFSGTINCNPGPEIDAENFQEHTLTGHVQE